MSEETQFIAATPILASLDIDRSLEFFITQLGFVRVHMKQGEYGIVSRDTVQIHFWPCSERHIAENTACRVRVKNIDSLYLECMSKDIVHPNARLEEKPWKTREFSIVDPDGNLVTFVEWNEGGV